MTVASETNRSGPYNGNGVTTIFNYNFKISDKTHLKVVLADAAGVETILTVDVDYIVSGVGAAVGGSVALVVAPAAGKKLTILRNVPLTQNTVLENQGAYYAKTVEDAFDLATMRDQQIFESLMRAIKLKRSSTSTEITFPDPEAGKIPVWNAAGTGLENKSAVDVAVTIAGPAGREVAVKNTVADIRDYLDTPVYVADRTALKALDTAKDTTAFLQEKGRLGTFVWTVGNFSTQIAADTAEGIYIKASAIASTAGAWVRVFSGLANVRWFGAALDDATDDTASFTAAFATWPDILFPVGRAYITNMVTVPNGGNLIGVGVGRSVFSVKATFTMAAAGVVQLGTAESMTFIDKIGFEFAQPTDGIRANLTQYPYAINHAGVPRVRIGHIRISRGWNGINATGNTGGSTYDFIECGVLNIGLDIDGALDTMNVGRLHVWPFGMSTGLIYTGCYLDGIVVGFQLGRCDGLAGEVELYAAKMVVTATAGSASRHLTSLHLDGDGARLQVINGPLDIDFLYSTKSVADAAQSILLSNGFSPNVRIGNAYIAVSNSGQPPILVNGGSLDINGGILDSRALGREAAYVQNAGSHLGLRNMELTALGARTESYVFAGAGNPDLVVENCSLPPNGGTGTAVIIAAGTTGAILGNAYNGRTVSNFSSVNDCDIWQAYTPTVTATAGAFTTVSATGRYRRIGKTVEFQNTISITNNGTAAAIMRTTLPLQNGAVPYVGFGREAAVSGKGVTVTIAASATTADIVFYDNTYPGATGAVINLSGQYELP